MEYLIKQYPLEKGALEIQYIEEFFGEFPRKKTAQEIINRRLGKGSCRRRNSRFRRCRTGPARKPIRSLWVR